MQKLLLLACLVAAAAAQQHFYCDRDSPITVSSLLTDFYVTTRRPSEASYSSDLSCEFRAESPSRAFFLDVTSFKVGSAVVTISSGDQVLFSGSSIPSFQTSMMTPSKSLKIRFDASGDRSGREGVTVRVRALNINGCPPGWTYMYGTCFGTGNTTYLNYVDAQRACNSMRSNLLHVPASNPGSLRTFMQQLPYSFRSSYTWIGMTDRASRFSYYWLDGSRQYSTYDISCYSSGSASTCYSYERCGSIYSSSLYAIFMDDCTDRNRYACSAPPGGTSYFYSVPALNSSVYTYVSTNYSLIWGAVAGSFVLIGLICVAIYAIVYSNRMQAQRRAMQGASSVVVSTGVVRVGPPAGGYPTQPPINAGGPSPPYPQYPQYSAAPPSYATVGGGGQPNAGFQ